MTDHRSAITGQYVTAAKNNPDTTVSESPCAECERLRGVVHAQGVALYGANVKIVELEANLDHLRTEDIPVIQQRRDELIARVAELEAAPIVRTVGDLTARHIGKRVRVEGCEYTLDHIGPSKCLFILGPGGYFPGQQFPLDTPCEVLG